MCQILNNIRVSFFSLNQYAILVHNVILEHSLQLHLQQEDQPVTRKLFRNGLKWYMYN